MSNYLKENLLKGRKFFSNKEKKLVGITVGTAEPKQAQQEAHNLSLGKVIKRIVF